MKCIGSINFISTRLYSKWSRTGVFSVQRNICSPCVEVDTSLGRDQRCVPGKHIPRQDAWMSSNTISRKLTQRAHSISNNTMSCQRIMNGDFFCLNDYDAYGFDLDHTLAKYKLANVLKLSYDSITEFLVEIGYDSRIQHDLEKFKDFISKGLVLDIKRGNILKLGEKGEILKAKHGTKDITKEKLKSIYGDALKFDHSETIMKTFKNSIKEFRFFENYFDVPGLVALVRLIDIIDEQHGSANNEHLYVDLWADVLKAVQNCYEFKNFRLDVGGFFPGVKKSPNDYVEKCSEDIRKWLRSLKENNKCVFLVTSSNIDFASLLLETILGDDWKSYFDVCVFYARKPAFFTEGHPFRRIDENNLEKEPVDEKQKNGFYSQGNHKDLYKLIGDMTNKPDPNVVYFGDNILADCYPAKHFANWATVLILEEMDAEGYICSDGTVPGHENDGGPSSKRKKFEEVQHRVDFFGEMAHAIGFSSTGVLRNVPLLTPARFAEIATNIRKLKIINWIIEPADCWSPIQSTLLCTKQHSSLVTPEEVEYLISKDWGPFLYHETVGNVKQVNGSYRMNTLWGSVISKYSCITVPSLEYLAGVPLSHKFEKFGPKVGNTKGFHPGIPSSLLP